jgi:hypothetical protein
VWEQVSAGQLRGYGVLEHGLAEGFRLLEVRELGGLSENEEFRVGQSVGTRDRRRDGPWNRFFGAA